MKRYLIGLILSTMIASAASATPACSPSASVRAYDYPGARVIPTSNNLLQPTGKALPADGQPLLLHGRVLDRECKPVVEAMVELWQTGPFGRWMVANREDLAGVRPVFAGAGRTYTDENGEFTFITAFPAPQRYDAPNINIRIKPEGMKEYKSALFFAGDERNAKERVFKRLGAEALQQVGVVVEQGDNDSLNGDITLVLPGNAPYRTY